MLDLTGQTVTDQQVAVANSVIELVSSRVYTIASPNTGTRDGEWLRRAVAWQCVWITGQPDYLTRLDINAITEGHKSIGLKDWALVLAPLAQRALAKLSWLRTRSIHVRSPWTDGMTPISSDPDSAANDFYQVWSPM